MNEIREPRPDATDLRRQAEAQARAHAAPALDPQGAPPPDQVLHELRVHQIELEMQNEELRRSQADLDLARARYFDLYDRAPVGYCTLDEMGLILEANRTACGLLGVAPQGLDGQPLTRFIFREDQDRYYLLRKALLATGAPQAWDLRMLRADGTAFWVRLEAAVATDPEGAVATRVILSEVSERKRLEAELQDLNQDLERRVAQRTQALEQANQELETFAYSLAHDLRAPCRAIAGFSAALDRDGASTLSAEGAGHLQRVQEGAARMARLIEDMLLLARIGRDDCVAMPLDFAGLAEQALARLQEGDPTRSVTWHVRRPLSVLGDPRLLRLLLDHLLGNAWKFTSLTPAACITVSAVALDSGQWEISIQDNGAGFPAAQVGHLFKPFHRLHRADAFPGSGIGLALAQRVVQRHGGQIRAAGVEGQGARFSFTLPASKASPP